jgi:telomere length regulation protein
MLAAEVIAEICNKKLNFDDWEGDDSGKPWCRDLRQLLKMRDVDANVNTLDTEEASVIVEEVSTPLAGKLASVGGNGQRATFVPNPDGYDSDDSMTGYASPPSSRSNSPSPSELAEIEKDPSLNVGIKKVSRPVYLAQLGDLFRGTGPNTNTNDPHEADKIEMALNTAEELIRKKGGYGTELGRI